MTWQWVTVIGIILLFFLLLILLATTLPSLTKKKDNTVNNINDNEKADRVEID